MHIVPGRSYVGRSRNKNYLFSVLSKAETTEKITNELPFPLANLNKR